MGGSSLHVEDEVENLYDMFEDWRSSVHVHYERALLNLLKIKRKTSQKVKELAPERNSLLLPRVTWSELSSCFRGCGRGFLISF